MAHLPILVESFARGIVPAGEIFGEIALLRPDGKRTATVVSRGG